MDDDKVFATTEVDICQAGILLGRNGVKYAREGIPSGKIVFEKI